MGSILPIFYRTIVKMRKDLEYKMLKKDKVLEDLIRYIDQEMKLLKMVRIRHKVSDCYADFIAVEKSH